MVVQMIQDDTLLTFKEAMSYLRVSRSTLYRLMWSGQLTGHKVGSTWRFYREDLHSCVAREISTASLPSTVLPSVVSISTDILPSVVTIPSDLPTGIALSNAMN
ncbi:MAG: helix-turn-helix domain-containing protein [Ktedonobacteraceae bacterium]|nr:helix-turn-helix domain-containing protein [Ktedonobacteraceae bacterium]